MAETTYLKNGNTKATGQGIRPSHNQRANRRPGLHVRLRREQGVTPKNVLAHPLRFPAFIGQEFSVEEEFPWEEFQSVGAGTFLIPPAGETAPSLRKFSGEVLTMTWDPRWFVQRGVNPKGLIRRLQWIGRHHAPFHMLVIQKPNHGMKADFAGLAVLTRMSVVTRRGEPDSRYVQCDFSQYREMTVRRRGRSDFPKYHRLTAKDTLRSLAKRYYGREKNWREIRKANGIGKWGGVSELIKLKRYKVGSWIKIPAEPEIHIGTSVSASGRGRSDDDRRVGQGTAEIIQGLD